MRTIAEDRGPVHHARMRQEVQSGVMGAQAIVPKRDVAEFPAPSDCELRLGHMVEQERKLGVALFGRQFDDARGEA